jgi:hypothetical protein
MSFECFLYILFIVYNLIISHYSNHVTCRILQSTTTFTECPNICVPFKSAPGYAVPTYYPPNVDGDWDCITQGASLPEKCSANCAEFIGYSGTPGSCNCVAGYGGTPVDNNGTLTGCTQCTGNTWAQAGNSTVCEPVSCSAVGYTGTSGACTCALGYYGTVTYTNGVLGGCTAVSCGVTGYQGNPGSCECIGGWTGTPTYTGGKTYFTYI